MNRSTCKRRPVLVASCAGLAAAFLVACPAEVPPKFGPAPPPAASTDVVIEARTFTIPTFPCSGCHAERPPDATERKLTEFHTGIELAHGKATGWCYRCHSDLAHDRLRVPDREPVTFDEAYELCGSCHGDKLRDWKAGHHGLTYGDWSGKKVRRSCTACHSPHKPKFPSMKPELPPDVAYEMHH